MALKKYLIIGAGPAALSALEEIRRTSSEKEIKLVSYEDSPPYSPGALSYLLSGRITEPDLWTKGKDYFKDLGSTLVTGKEVTHIIPEKNRVIYHDGDSESYDFLLISSGSEPIKPKIEGLGKTDIYNFRTLADYRRLLQKLNGAKDVAILGGGLVGMHLALALLERGHQVNVIEKEQRVLPSYFNEEAEIYMREIFANQKASLLTGKSVIKVKRQNRKMELCLSDSSSVKADVLINAIGVKSRISFLENTGINTSKSVLVDRRMKTSVPDIYAAGDVADNWDFFNRNTRVNGSIPSAVGQGRVAGINMAGGEAEYEGGIPMVAFNFFGNSAFSIGLPEPLDHGCQVFKKTDGKKKRFKKLIFNGNRLIGGMFLNETINPGIVLYLIKRKMDLSPYREALFEGTKPLMDPWLSSLRFPPK